MSKIKFLSLGKQPITNNFLIKQNPINEFFYDLNIVYDENTKVVSLESFVLTAISKSSTRDSRWFEFKR